MSTRITQSLDDGRTEFKKQEAAFSTSSAHARETDPSCGMLVDPNQASTVKLEMRGLKYYFCSAQCKHLFEDDPEEFIAAT